MLETITLKIVMKISYNSPSGFVVYTLNNSFVTFV